MIPHTRRAAARANWRHRCVCASLVLWLAGARVVAQRLNPYAAEGAAHDLGRIMSLEQLDNEAGRLARTAKTAYELGLVAELYKRLGKPLAATYYEKAIAAAPEDPGWELLYADYLRLYRGAGQLPLHPRAAHHLFEALRKLELLTHDRARQEEWDDVTAERARRSRAALYERDGFQLASHAVPGSDASSSVSKPWLFLSTGGRTGRTMADLDQASDNRLLASAVLLSASRGHQFTIDEYREIAHSTTPREASMRLRVRPGAGPVIDASFVGRETPNLQTTDFHQPTAFNDLTLLDAGFALEQPFSIGETTDASIRGGFHRVQRRGLIEHRPLANEQVKQFELSGALSRYFGPDRIGVSYVTIVQHIAPDGAEERSRRFSGATVTYQIFRPLPLRGRDFNTGSGRRFETRGIDLSAGFVDSRERFPAASGDVFVIQRDYFVGVSAKGLGRFDVGVQPAWYSSRADDDSPRRNGHVRIGGHVLTRLMDEERTPGLPSERVFGLPIAFVHAAVPFHWDIAREGPDIFGSRRVGMELWTKLLAPTGSGVAVLGVVGYSSAWFPALDRRVNLARAQLSVGF
jgi:hypothetical protein